MVVYDRKTDSKRRPSEDDLSMLLKSGALIGSKRVSAHMRPFMFKAERDYSLHSATNAAPDTVDSAFDLKTTWNQLNLAALMVAGILKPETQLLFVASNERSKIAATRAANLLNAQVMTGRYVPGTLTNPLQKTFCEPSFIVCASATEDVQAIKESALSNTAVIAFCDGTASLNQIDIPISCNTHSRLSIGVMFYLLVRQILRLKGTISNNEDIPNLTVDNFIQQKKINPSSQNKAGSNAQNERGNKRERSEKSQYKKRRNNNQSNSKEGTKAQTTSGLDENNEANYENKNNQNNQEEDDWN